MKTTMIRVKSSPEQVEIWWQDYRKCRGEAARNASGDEGPRDL